MKQKTLHTLRVQLEDEGAEIFILDHRFIRIEATAGRHASFSLAPGVYIVKVRVGTICREESVVLAKDETVVFGPIGIPSAAPLEGTTKTHEYQMDNAESHSKRVHVRKGKGSHLFLFVRYWTSEPVRRKTKAKQAHPATGLWVKDFSGKININLEEKAFYDKQADPWAACNIELDPGVYRLCLETAEGKILEQSVVTCRDWQTQLFLLQHNYGIQRNDPRADLDNMSVFMAKGKEGFKSRKFTSNLKLAEQARLALIDGRTRLSKELLRHALSEKFTNPMLGIFGAHLLLKDRVHEDNEGKHRMLTLVVKNLRKLLGAHPDVEAIALKAGLPVNFIFNEPPMLRSSWTYILEATVKKPLLMPAGSYAAGIAGLLWGQGAWLIWMKTTQLDQFHDMLVKQVEKMAQMVSTQSDQMVLPPLGSMRLDLPMSASVPAHSASSRVTSKKGKVKDESLSESDNKNMLYMVQALGLPRASLESILQSPDHYKSESSVMVRQPAGENKAEKKEKNTGK
ncbi:MAG TPA: hypothetical protein VGN63_18775 [Flavisolibacter sp.]|nr:hypothetical protein [Flavisolibacter sp.]